MPADPGGAVGRCLRRAARLPDPADPPDGRLLDRFRRAGDEAAFAELVRRHGPMVLGVCRRAAGNRADADDAFQAAFLVLVRRAAELTARPTVGDFLYGVAVRTALKARATAVKRRLKEARAARPEAAPEPAGEPDGAAALDRELARLPEKYRAALVLCELEGRPRKDVAGLLGIPEGTLSSRLAAGRKLLADRLRRCGLAAPAGGLAAASTASAVPPALVETTIRAAVVSAGHAAGAVPAAANQLAADVTRAMFVTKLRAGVLVLAAALVGSAAGLTGLSHAVADAPAKAAVRSADGFTTKQLIQKERAATDALKGTWELQTRTLDGTEFKLGDTKVIDGQEHHMAFLYYRLTFGDRTVKTAWKSSDKDGETHEGESGVTLNPTADPAQINIFGKGTLLLGVYKLDGDTLMLATHGISELERPKGFDHADKRIADLPLTVDVYKRVKKDDPKPKAAGGAGKSPVSADAAPEPKVPPIGERAGPDVVGPPAEGEAVWMAPFRKAYGLADGQALKVVPGDQFGDARGGYFAKAHPTFDTPGDWVRAFATDGRRLVGWGGHSAGDGTDRGRRGGLPLWQVVEGFHLNPRPVLAGDDDLLGAKLYADVVVREGATLSEIARDLPAALKAAGLAVTATARPEEREVVVARGKFNPAKGAGGAGVFIPGAEAGAVLDLSAGPIKAPPGGVHLNVTRFRDGLFPRLGDVAGRPVVDETEADSWGEKLGGFRYVRRAKDDPRPQDRSADGVAVLDHFTAQTGLAFTVEKRTVWVLTVRAADAADPHAAKPAPPPAKKDDRPAWRQDFDKTYALADGEVLKRVAPPFPPARAEYLKAELLGGLKLDPGDRLDHWHALFRWVDGKGLHGETSAGGPPGKPAAVALQELLARLNRDLLPNEIVGDEELLRAAGVDGDFVVRHGADPAKVVARLTDVLRTDCKLPVRVGFREEEREVAVATGALKVEPLPGRDKDRVEVYAEALADPNRRPAREGTAGEFLRDLGRFVGTRVVAGKGFDPQARLSWRENVRPADVADPAAEHDLTAVLKNVSDQTGLRFLSERRKVKVLFVERDEK